MHNNICKIKKELFGECYKFYFMHNKVDQQ